jgi:hypothetical protein
MVNQQEGIGFFFTELKLLPPPVWVPIVTLDQVGITDSASLVKCTRWRKIPLVGTKIYMRPKVISPYYDLVNVNGTKIDKMVVLFADRLKREINRMEHCLTVMGHMSSREPLS